MPSRSWVTSDSRCAGVRTGSRSPRFRLLLGFLPVLLPGCTGYHPRPLEPGIIAERLSKRRLQDRGLARFARDRRRPGQWPPAVWDLEDLTLAAVYFHPDVEVAGTRLQAAGASVRTAGGKPVAGAGTRIEYNTDARGTPWTVAFQASLPVETAGKRRLRVQEARWLERAAWQDVSLAIWNTRRRVRDGLLDLLLQERDLATLRREETLRHEAVGLLERRFEVGEAAAPDVDTARLELGRTRTVRGEAEGALARARVRLAGAMGIPVRALAGIRLRMARMEPPATQAFTRESLHEASLINRLDIRRLLAEYGAAEARLALEVRRQYPDLSLGPGLTFEEGDRKYAIATDLVRSILSGNRGPIAQAEAGRLQVRARLLSVQADALARVDEAVAVHAAATSVFREADRNLRRLREGRLRSVERRFQAGEEDRLSLCIARTEATVAEREYTRALRRVQEALGALEDAVQRPLDCEDPFPPALALRPSGEEEDR